MKKNITEYLAKHQGTILRGVLGVICLIFISILIVVYIAARRANPVFLDETGKPIASQTN